MNKRTETSLRKNAQRGAQKLDKLFPDWFKQHNIALNRLDLSDSTNCVAGQLIHNPKAEAFLREANGGFIEAMNEYEDRYGFDVRTYDINLEQDGYAILDDEWRKLITERLTVA